MIQNHNQKHQEKYHILERMQEEAHSRKDDDKPLTFTANINYL